MRILSFTACKSRQANFLCAGWRSR
jgi:hypothetical protein